MNRGPVPFEESTGTPLAAQHATAREFLTVVFRRKWIILSLFAVTTVTVVVMTLGQKAEFASSGQVLVRRGEQESVMTPTRRSTVARRSRSARISAESSTPRSSPTGAATTPRRWSSG